MSSADLPFKCHLCEGSYAERQEALDHIRESHPSEFELLMSKGALDSSSSTAIEDNNNVSSNMTQHPDDGNAGGEESLEHLRGKFPDYANRKVSSLLSVLHLSYFQLPGRLTCFDESLHWIFAVSLRGFPIGVV